MVGYWETSAWSSRSTSISADEEFRSRPRELREFARKRLRRWRPSSSAETPEAWHAFASVSQLVLHWLNRRWVYHRQGAIRRRWRPLPMPVTASAGSEGPTRIRSPATVRSTSSLGALCPVLGPSNPLSFWGTFSNDVAPPRLPTNHEPASLRPPISLAACPLPIHSLAVAAAALTTI